MFLFHRYLKIVHTISVFLVISVAVDHFSEKAPKMRNE